MTIIEKVELEEILERIEQGAIFDKDLLIVLKILIRETIATDRRHFLEDY